MKRSHKNAKRRTRTLAIARSGGERLGLAGFHRAPRMRHEDDGRGRHRLERHEVHQELRHGGRREGDPGRQAGW